ncbi:hypothetical protein BHM04_08120 [Macrococcus sp. IME1552]|nr:DEAD/DEAH box helicase family protein [Macrococcus sp. IME1552]ATD31156.1 hypothetical protein BHM04_08120 [Macrococcus sp. IME1552]
MLSSLNFKYTYRSNEDKLYNDFYLPCLQNSIKFDRAAGYFTSGSLKLIAKGLEHFFDLDGKIRIICNPKLLKEDLEAIQNGYLIKEEIIEQSIFREYKLTKDRIEDNTLEIISILIYLGKLDFKIAFAKENAIYHEKFGIFTDSNGDSISFSGSANETYGGLSSNFEKIDVYFNKNDKHRIDNAIDDFENLWNNNTKSIDVISLPNALKYELYNIGKENFNNKFKQKSNVFTPRDYQKKAITEWFDNNNKGIFEMATGTGKTITSLLAGKELFENKKRLFTLIVVPFNHLIDQWLKDIKKITNTNVLNCSGSKKEWTNKATNMIIDFNLELEDECIFITTYKTVISKEMEEILLNVKGESFVLFDECHYITTNGFKSFPFNIFEFRLGLSATPDRWWDEEGTSFLKKNIGDVIYTYDLDEAIRNNKLTEYKYIPKIVPFEEDEILKYNELTRKIIRTSNNDDEDKKKIEILLRQRANLISKAKNKLEIFREDFKKLDKRELRHTIVYCAPGQVNIITKIISDLDIRVSKFNSEVENIKRIKILDLFEKGEIQVLVAIKCLDEGVDIPMTKRAYFLSSTSNPREFVQRRGRILRLHKDKYFAELFDYIVLPVGLPESDFKNIAVKELPRFAEFNRSAINSSEGKNVLLYILEQYNLEYLLYKTPWDVYHENKERIRL